MAHAIVNAAFAGFFLETLFYGALCVVYGAGTWKVFSRQWNLGIPRRDQVLLLGNACMFVFATIVSLLSVCNFGPERLTGRGSTYRWMYTLPS